MAESTLDAVRRIVGQSLAIDIDRVLPRSNFIDDLGADSLDMMEIAIGIDANGLLRRKVTPAEDREMQGVETAEDVAAAIDAINATAEEPTAAGRVVD